MFSLAECVLGEARSEHKFVCPQVRDASESLVPFMILPGNQTRSLHLGFS